MTFIVKKPESQFSDEPCPEGLTQAVCVDAWDLGMKDTKYGPKHKMKFVFETPHRDSKGQPIRVSTWPYTVSLHENAQLRKDLERWRGRRFTVDELRGFDLDSVVGAPAMLNIKHNSGEDGTVYSNIDGIFSDKNPSKYQAMGTYRRAERKQEEPVGEEREHEFDDEPVPF